MLHKYSFLSAPCLRHTPPFLASLVHPSLLHSLTFAPCFWHTPPFLAIFAHPTLLHSLCTTFAPCLMHTPPFRAWFVHPSAEHFFTCLFFGALFEVSLYSAASGDFRFLPLGCLSSLFTSTGARL